MKTFMKITKKNLTVIFLILLVLSHQRPFFYIFLVKDNNHQKFTNVNYLQIKNGTLNLINVSEEYLSWSVMKFVCMEVYIISRLKAKEI